MHYRQGEREEKRCIGVGEVAQAATYRLMVAEIRQWEKRK
jgi:hypothetical protein